MSNVKFYLNSDGVKELLQSPEMQEIIGEKAKQVEAIAGAGYEGSVKVGKKRSYATIAATSLEAKRDNLKNNTLIKALGSLKG